MFSLEGGGIGVADAGDADTNRISTVAAVWMIQRLSGEMFGPKVRALSRFKYPVSIHVGSYLAPG